MIYMSFTRVYCEYTHITEQSIFQISMRKQIPIKKGN